jgi:predicted dehydrogenase
MRKKIRVAVIGVGYLGKLHAEKYTKIEGAELVGVVDADLERAKEIASSLGVRAYANHADLIGKVDAVSIVTPTESHCRIGLDFLSRGIDALVEKPIAATITEAERLVKEAKKTKTVLQIGHLERFNAAVVGLSKLVKKPRYIETRRLAPFPNRSTDVDVVLDLMIHDIDIVLNIAKSAVMYVEASAVPVVSDKADFANARVVFKNGCVANLTASRASKDRVRTLHLFQDNGENLKVDYIDQTLTVSRGTGKAEGEKVAFEEAAIVKSDSLLEELKAFVECSADRTTPPVSGTDGLNALQLANLIQATAKKRLTVR